MRSTNPSVIVRLSFAVLAQGFLHLLAAFRLGYLISRALYRNRLCSKDF